MRTHTIKTLLFAVTFYFVNLFALYSQQVNQEEFIKVALWAETDAYPGAFPSDGDISPSDDMFEYPRSRLRELAPFILEGMVYGWEFEYTPSDKARGVAEYFEFRPIVPFESAYGTFGWSAPWIADNAVWVWLEFARTDAMQRYYRMWQSVNFKKITGCGYAPLSQGFDGIRQAYEEAMKLAVREYARTIEKNKPKEITGKVLLTGTPRLYTDSGRYAADLDFLLDIGRIIPYTQF